MAASFFLLTIAIVLVLSAVIALSRERAVHRYFDARLHDTARSIAQRAESRGAVSPGELRDLFPGELPSAPRVIQFRDADGRVLEGSRIEAPIPTPSVISEAGGPWHGTASVPWHSQTVTVSAESGIDPLERTGSYRIKVIALQVRMTDRVVDHVVIAVSMATFDRLTWSILRTLLWSAGAAAVAAGVAGWIAAGGIAHRIEAITQRVASITPMQLESGVQLPEQGDELGRLAQALNATFGELNRAFRSQERFISDVSHELKTPLAAMLTEAQVLRSVESTHEDYLAFARSVEEEARWLGKKVESFLVVARFGHGRRYVAEGYVSLNDVAIDTIKHASILARQQNVELTLSAYDSSEDCHDGLVRGDVDLLRVALDNIVRNAIQFSPSGSSVQIAVTCVEKRMEIQVRDHGPGIDPQYVDRIFNRFEQAPVRGSGRRGTGLGLAIAKGVVELHTGMIRVENHPEGGCVFHIALPLADPGSDPERFPSPTR